LSITNQTMPTALGPPPRAKARQHSRLVRVMRWALPMGMVAVLGLIAGLIGQHSISRRGTAHEPANQIVMTNPHFFGRDSQGRAFMLSARQAARDPQDFQKVLLQFPHITQDVDGANPQTLTADSGVYREDTRILVMRGNVHADNSKDSAFATQEATINTRTGTVVGPQAIQGQTNMGHVKSNSFDVYDKGDRVIYKGGVHARLNQH
jgi:lipopolysaccharide export system protein LptC